jgi:hypothetical protein
MKRFAKLFLASAFALAVAMPVPVEQANAAASAQVTHVYLCAPEPSVGTAGPRRVVNTASTASPQPSYQLNALGCALFANPDVGFFLSQGFFISPAETVVQQNAITANTTGTTSTLVLPPYGFVKYVVIEETGGGSITGGLNVGDSGSATRFLSATAVSANLNVVVVPTNLTGSSNTGVPTADTILVAAVTGFAGGASLNISVIIGYF